MSRKAKCRDCGKEIEPNCESQTRCYLCIGEGCRIERTVLVEHGFLDLRTGEHTTNRAVWETKPCGTPLFGKDSRERGICDGCRDGWTHPENFPTVRGREQIAQKTGRA